MSSNLLSGVLAPVVTPFSEDLAPDPERLVAHCRWLLSQNCGLAIFGTNSEANSLSVDERLRLLDAVVAAGLDPGRMMPGTGCCSIVDSARLTSHAVSHGAGGVLMLAPFYYKNVSDEGLYRNFAEVIERVGDDRLRVYLYHFPQMSAVPFSLELVQRLVRDFPGIVVGMKDSSGDRARIQAVLEALPGFGYFVGSEMLLLENLRAGGVGCISATANVNPAAIARLCDGYRSDEAEAMQAALDAVRGAVQAFPLIPALKTILSHYRHDPDWNRLRPPLVELGPKEGGELISVLQALHFELK
jgi:4-hydroxy-tetrahydrodipicolinate synthase